MLMFLREFHSWNQMTYNHQVLIGDNTIHTYGSSLPKHIGQCDSKAHVLTTVAFTTIWPRDYLEVDVPKSELDSGDLIAVNKTSQDPLVCLQYSTRSA